MSENNDNIDLHDITALESIRQGVPCTFEEYSQMLEVIVARVLEGYDSPLQTLTVFALLSDAYEKIKPQIMTDAIGEFYKFKEGSKNELLFGLYSISEGVVGVSYDYSNDVIWRNLNDELQTLRAQYIEPIEARMKKREEYLRGYAKRTDQTVGIDVDETTGEQFTVVAPIIKSGKNSLKLTLIKKSKK